MKKLIQIITNWKKNILSEPRDAYENMFRKKRKGVKYKINRELSKQKAEEADKMIEEWKEKVKPLDGVERVNKQLKSKIKSLDGSREVNKQVEQIKR